MYVYTYLCIYMYISIYTSMCTYIYIYIYGTFSFVYHPPGITVKVSSTIIV